MLTDMDPCDPWKQDAVSYGTNKVFPIILIMSADLRATFRKKLCFIGRLFKLFDCLMKYRVLRLFYPHKLNVLFNINFDKKNNGSCVLNKICHEKK